MSLHPLLCNGLSPPQVAGSSCRWIELTFYARGPCWGSAPVQNAKMQITQQVVGPGAKVTRMPLQLEALLKRSWLAAQQGPGCTTGMQSCCCGAKWACGVAAPTPCSLGQCWCPASCQVAAQMLQTLVSLLGVFRHHLKRPAGLSATARLRTICAKQPSRHQCRMTLLQRLLTCVKHPTNIQQMCSLCNGVTIRAAGPSHHAWLWCRNSQETPCPSRRQPLQ